MGDGTMNYSASPQNLHKYNGKEWQPELNLNTYDFGARHYDPVLGRWTAIDPLADESEGLSPYNYVENNPMNLIDPDGMQPNGGGYQYGFPVGNGSAGGSFGGLGAAGAGIAGANGILQGFAAYKAFGFKSVDPQSFGGLSKVQGNAGPGPQAPVSSAAKQGGEDFSLGKMYSHFQTGEKQPMKINSTTLDFTSTTQKELGLVGMKVGQTRIVNLFRMGTFNPIALAFGKVTMSYKGNNQFAIEKDIFDFNIEWSKGFSARNFGTVAGGAINYNLFILPELPLIYGGSYDVLFKGLVTIK